MASSGKKRTTMAKLNRESRLREKRAEKQTRKAARKLSAVGEPVYGDIVRDDQPTHAHDGDQQHDQGQESLRGSRPEPVSDSEVRSAAA